MATGSSTVDGLVELGFSQYEAKAYVGLLGNGPMTGYALSNATGIPQPKVYETLRRLARKGVAIALEGEPLRFVAVPPAQVLTQIDTSFRRRLAEAELGLMREASDSEQPLRVFEGFADWHAVEQRAVQLIEEAARHVYLSLNCDAAAVVDAVSRTDARGVQMDVLHFGKGDLTVEHGRSLRHASTAGVVYRHHQARHLAVVADSTKVLWALAPDGRDWQAVAGNDVLLAAAVKGYVRHDMYVQQISRDFGGLLEESYGPGLEELVVPSGETARQERRDQPAARLRRGTASTRQSRATS